MSDYSQRNKDVYEYLREQMYNSFLLVKENQELLKKIDEILKSDVKLKDVLNKKISDFYLNYFLDGVLISMAYANEKHTNKELNYGVFKFFVEPTLLVIDKFLGDYPDEEEKKSEEKNKLYKNLLKIYKKIVKKLEKENEYSILDNLSFYKTLKIFLNNKKDETLFLKDMGVL